MYASAHISVLSILTSSFTLLLLVLGVPYEVGVDFGRALLAPVPSLLNGFVKSGGTFLHTSPCFA
jgi:hypothetical protein